MHTFFYSNISDFSGNFQGITDEVTQKTSIQTMHIICWKAKYFKSTYVSVLGHGCGVSQYPQFYDKIKKKYQMLSRLYVGVFSGKKGHQFFQ